MRHRRALSGRTGGEDAGLGPAWSDLGCSSAVFRKVSPIGQVEGKGPRFSVLIRQGTKGVAHSHPHLVSVGTADQM